MIISTLKPYSINVYHISDILKHKGNPDIQKLQYVSVETLTGKKREFVSFPLIIPLRLNLNHTF